LLSWLNPKDAKTFDNRGNAYDEKGNHDRAIADYNEASQVAESGLRS
jgi:Flp pilus assembly protein TadD